MSSCLFGRTRPAVWIASGALLVSSLGSLTAVAVPAAAQPLPEVTTQAPAQPPTPETTGPETTGTGTTGTGSAGPDSADTGSAPAPRTQAQDLETGANASGPAGAEVGAADAGPVAPSTPAPGRQASASSAPAPAPAPGQHRAAAQKTPAATAQQATSRPTSAATPNAAPSGNRVQDARQAKASADAAVRDARRAVAREQAAVEAARKQFHKGSAGFFVSVGPDGEEAAYLLTDQRYHDRNGYLFTAYTDPSDPADAAHLDRMRATFPYLHQANALRARGGVDGQPLPELRVTHMMMALAQVNTNWADVHQRHAADDNEQRAATYIAGENLAWPFVDENGEPFTHGDPFLAWYDLEKDLYEYEQTHGTRQGWDANKNTWWIIDDTGHYLTLVDGDYVTTGYAINLRGSGAEEGWPYGTHGQVFGPYWSPGSATTYTVAEYEQLFNAYYDAVNPATAEAALAAAWADLAEKVAEAERAARALRDAEAALAAATTDTERDRAAGDVQAARAALDDATSARDDAAHKVRDLLPEPAGVTHSPDVNHSPDVAHSPKRAVPAALAADTPFGQARHASAVDSAAHPAAPDRQDSLAHTGSPAGPALGAGAVVALAAGALVLRRSRLAPAARGWYSS